MMDMNYSVPIVACILYGLFCYVGPLWMKNSKPFRLDFSLAIWNLLLAIFSAYCTIRTVPHLIHRILTVSFEETICDPAHMAFGSGACGLAVALFIISKIPELVDTIFIILRKKPLIFLHWYHHLTVLIFCWNSYVTESGAGIYFVAMNSLVHAVMYFYYFLQAIKAMPKWFPSWIVTLLQISQMIIGVFIVVSSLYFHVYGGEKYEPKKCHNEYSNLVSGSVIYASYLFLVLDFAFRRFVFGGKGKRE